MRRSMGLRIKVCRPRLRRSLKPIGPSECRHGFRARAEVHRCDAEVEEGVSIGGAEFDRTP
ncbi:hypothetical protein D3C87_2126590 [compost metagenome]